MEDLRAFGVPVLILSGGEPLMRPDLFDLAHSAKALGFYVALSTNGTLIDAALIPRIREARFDYLGISLDGLEATHDRFRRRPGAFRESLQGLRLCRDAGIRVGMRFTLTKDNAADLPGLLDLMEAERIDKFYLSHLNYAGRGNTNRGDDAHFRMTREAMDLLFDTCWGRIQAGVPMELVTGNNDADAVYLLHWAAERFPDRAERPGRGAAGLGRQRLRGQCRQHRQPGQCPPGHLLVEPRPGQCPRAALRGDLGGPLGPAHGRPQAEPAPGEGALRRLRLPRHLQRQHPHPRLPGER